MKLKIPSGITVEEYKSVRKRYTTSIYSSFKDGLWVMMSDERLLLAHRHRYIYNYNNLNVDLKYNAHTILLTIDLPYTMDETRVAIYHAHYVLEFLDSSTTYRDFFNLSCREKGAILLDNIAR